MPNWCYNKLTVKGENEDLTIFKEKAKSKEEGIDTDIRMNNFIELPRELVNTCSPWEKPNWYDWALENWGCKWDLDAVLVEETVVDDEIDEKNDNILIYRFDSPWGPPYIWVKSVAQMFPDISFELYYKEPGVCFQGTILAQNDLFVDDQKEYIEDIYTDGTSETDEVNDYEKFVEKGKIRRYDINGNDITNDITKCEYCENEINLKDREYELCQSAEGKIIVDKLYNDIEDGKEEGCTYNIPYFKSERFVNGLIKCCEYPYYSPYMARMDGKNFSNDRQRMKENAVKYHKRKEKEKKKEV